MPPGGCLRGPRRPTNGFTAQGTVNLPTRAFPLVCSCVLFLVLVCVRDFCRPPSPHPLTPSSSSSPNRPRSTAPSQADQGSGTFSATNHAVQRSQISRGQSGPLGRRLRLGHAAEGLPGPGRRLGRVVGLRLLVREARPDAHSVDGRHHRLHIRGPGGPAGHPRPPHGAQAQRSRGGVLRPPPHCPADAGVPGRSALPLGHRPEHGLGEAPPRLDQPSIMALGGMGTGRKGAQRDATSGAAPICTVTETLGTLHYYWYETARERGEGAALLIMLHAARHAHAFTLPP